MTKIGTMTDVGDSNFLNGSQIATGALGGRAVLASFYVRGPLDAAGFRKFQIAVYRDVGGYAVGPALGISKVGTLQADAWNTLVIAAQLQPNSKYWLLANNNGRNDGVNRMVFDIGIQGVGMWSSGSVPFGTWPAQFQSTVTNIQFSIYITLLP